MVKIIKFYLYKIILQYILELTSTTDIDDIQSTLNRITQNEPIQWSGVTAGGAVPASSPTVILPTEPKKLSTEILPNEPKKLSTEILPIEIINKSKTQGKGSVTPLLNSYSFMFGERGFVMMLIDNKYVLYPINTEEEYDDILKRSQITESEIPSESSTEQVPSTQEVTQEVTTEPASQVTQETQVTEQVTQEVTKGGKLRTKKLRNKFKKNKNKKIKQRSIISV